MLGVTCLYAVFSFLNALRAYYGFSLESGDYHIFEQMFYHTSRGNFFYNSFEGGNHLAVHFSPILILFVPLTALFPSGMTLIAVTVLSFALGGYLLYRHAQRAHRPEACVPVLILLWMHGTMTHNTRDFHELNLLPICLILAFVFYEQRRLTAFLAALFAMAAIRESLFFTIGAWSVIALCQDRSRGWVLLPTIPAGLCFFVGNLLIPAFMPSRIQTLFLHHLQAFGRTPREIAATILTRPDVLWEQIGLTLASGYLFEMFLPFLFVLPFFRWWWLPAAPAAAYIVFSGHPRLLDPHAHFSIEVFMWALISTWVFLRDRRAFFARPRVKRTITALLVVLALNYSVRTIDASLRLAHHVRADRYRDFREVASAIPSDATIMARPYLLNHLAQRDHLYILLEDRPAIPEKIDIVIIEEDRTGIELPAPWQETIRKGNFVLYVQKRP